MVECNSIEHNPVEISSIYPGLNQISLSDQQHFRLNKINEIKTISLQRLNKEN